MVRFIGKRILQMIPVILGISLIIFTILDFTPGDPARMKLGANASPEDVEELREEWGLNDPFFTRFVNFWKGVFRWDFGVSWRTGFPVAEEMADRIPVTLTLAFLSALIMVIIGIPIGVVSAVKQYSLIDNISMVVALTLASIPSFWFGLMLMLLFAFKLGWLPATGVESFSSYILPSITAAACLTGSLVRVTRSNMLEVIRQEYISTARAKGAPERSVIFTHALRNALLPVITVVGNNFGIMIAGALITETVFALPGVGSLLITSVRNKDVPVVMTNILFVAVIISVINLIVDIIYTFVDPRLKTVYMKH